METGDLKTVCTKHYGGFDYSVGSSNSITYTAAATGSSLYDNYLVSHALTGVHHPHAESSGNTVDDIFEDRLGLIRSKLDLILLQLKKRKAINQSILYQIDYDGCHVQSLQFELGGHAYVMGGDRLTLEKLKLDLERQKRMEQVSYFRDTGMLNTELKDTLIQYLEEVQKNEFLNGEDD